MRNFLERYKVLWLGLAVILIAAIFLVAPLHIAQAAESPWCDSWPLSCSFINWIVLGIPYLYGFIGGILLQLAGVLVDFAFSINTSVLPDQFGIIQLGFQVCLSLANVIFVIALIIIAFCTILNIEEYSAKKMLGKLITAAVLINFSLLIAGLILDFSHVVTNFFLGNGPTLSSGDRKSVV